MQIFFIPLRKIELYDLNQLVYLNHKTQRYSQTIKRPMLQFNNSGTIKLHILKNILNLNQSFGCLHTEKLSIITNINKC